MMFILVCGGRHFNNYLALKCAIDEYVEIHGKMNEPVEIVSGGCDGADKLAERYANENDFVIHIFPAEWKKYGRAAGPIRNKQMIDFIKDKSSVVIAFVSKDTIGTKGTVQLAKKNNIEVVEIPYQTFEETTELFEGVRVNSSGEYELDWNVDSPEDLVKLEGTCVHITRYRKNIRCYGFRVNKTPSNKKDRNDFLSFLKNTPSAERNELISKCVEEFYDKSAVKHFDYVVTVPSRSSINTELVNQLEKYDSFSKISLIKKPVSTLELDINKIKSKFHGDYFEKFVEYLQTIIDYNKKEGNFSISTFKPQYRGYIKSMIDFGDNTIENKHDCNILIVDDIFTSGGTIDMVLKLFEEINFQGTITILTLLQNR